MVVDVLSARPLRANDIRQKQKNFADRDEAVIAVESEEIADLYRDTVEIGFGGAVFFFYDIKRMYKRLKSEE